MIVSSVDVGFISELMRLVLHVLVGYYLLTQILDTDLFRIMYLFSKCSYSSMPHEFSFFIEF